VKCFPLACLQDSPRLKLKIFAQLGAPREVAPPPPYHRTAGVRGLMGPGQQLFSDGLEDLLLQ
jgi:hypothetical protein